MAFKITFVGLVALLIAAALIQVGLADPARGGAATVRVSQSKLGRILVNRRGRSLYLFEKDKRGRSSCYGACATYWPPLIVSGKPRAGTGAKASLLGRTKRRDGRWQVTYKRHPLYTYVGDTKKAQTNGEGLDDFGAEWDLVSPSGAKVEKNEAQSRSGGNSGFGGYGYGP
jgi:predicted lipoprotein with Yx(FWY)xxD motif